MVPGSRRQAQAVLYTAHYDHLGIDPDAKGDNIYNGAADNGTGCGILLEMARAFAQSKLRRHTPSTSPSVTAEEQGLLGSQYLGMHPPVPAAQITLDLNYDMLHAHRHSPSATELGGAERTTFYPDGGEDGQGTSTWSIEPDDTPAQATTTAPTTSAWRALACRRSPSIRAPLFEGHDAEWGKQQIQGLRRHHYHQPSDEYRADWDFRGNAKLAQFGFILGWQASALPLRVGLAARR